MNLSKLTEPLDPKRVKHREGGGGRSLSYLEGHDVIRAANEIFGIGGWSYQLRKLTCLGTEDFVGSNNRKGIRVAYSAELEVGVRLGLEADQAVYGDVGYGDAIEYGGSILTPHELASKEAVTDALKRALKNLGDQFGLCLYDKFAPEHNGRSQTGSGNALGGSAAGVGDEGKGAAVTSSAAAPENFVWPFGKFKGKTLAETDESYLDWFLQNGKADDIKQLIADYRGFSLQAELVAAGAREVDQWNDQDSDIPFLPTIDGLGN